MTEQIKTRVVPQDAELAARQWAEWRHSRRHLIKMGAFGGAAAAMAGGAGGHPFLQSASAQDAPKSGGKISMSLADQDPTSWDPPVPPDNMSIWTMLLFYDQLVRPTSDGTALEPGLATDWSASEDGMTYTFTLRDAMFHDGTPVTADDVVYCIDRAAKYEGTPWTFILSALESATAVDAKTVAFKLKTPWAPFEADLSLFSCSIFPKAAHEAQGDAFFDKPIGSGPFQFVSYEKGVAVVLQKNASYWEAGKPYLDELTFKILPDSNARMLQFQGGELDIVTNVPFNQIDSIAADENYVYVENAVARIDYIAINTTREPFTDKNLRQAINYAVDKATIIDSVLYGKAEMATSFLPKMPGRDPNSAGYPYDLAKAQELVANSAGKDGWEATLWLAAGDSVAAEIAVLVQANLADIGGNVTIQQDDPNSFLDRTFNSRDFDLTFGYYTTDIIDPDELASFAVLSNGGTMALGTGYNNPEVDALIGQAQTELDPAKRQEIYNQIQAMQLADAPFIFLYYPGGRSATQKYVKNFNILPTGNYRLWETWRDDV